jgi:hypothetical protein
VAIRTESAGSFSSRQHERVPLIQLTLVPDDRSSATTCLRRSRTGGHFALRLHLARLADRAGRRGFAAVTESSPEETNGHHSDAKRQIS